MCATDKLLLSLLNVHFKQIVSVNSKFNCLIYLEVYGSYIDYYNISKLFKDMGFIVANEDDPLFDLSKQVIKSVLVHL